MVRLSTHRNGELDDISKADTDSLEAGETNPPRYKRRNHVGQRAFFHQDVHLQASQVPHTLNLANALDSLLMQKLSERRVIRRRRPYPVASSPEFTRERLRRTDPDEASAIENCNAVTEFESLFRIMRGQEHRASVPFDDLTAQESTEFPCRYWVE